jgi:excisionase family DNA binding protein
VVGCLCSVQINFLAISEIEPMPDLTFPLQVSVSISERTLTEVIRLTLKLFEEIRSAEIAYKAAKDSKRALLGAKKSPNAESELLLDNDQVSKLLKLSAKTLYTMRKEKRMPEPMVFGSAIRWRHEELRAWINAGCPPQSEWKFEAKRL